MCAVVEWSFAAGMEAATVGIAQKNTLVQNRVSGGGCRADTFHGFCFGISPGDPLPDPTLSTALFYCAIGSDRRDHDERLAWLIWNSFRYSLTETNSLIYGHGPGYYVLIAYDYVIVLLGMTVMISAWFQSKQPYRRQNRHHSI